MGNKEANIKLHLICFLLYLVMQAAYQVKPPNLLLVRSLT